MSHDFHESLAKSHAAEDLPLWEAVYRKAFWNFQGMFNHRQDGDHQRLGVDRTVVLNTGKTLAIDEKIRFQDYGDILLEYMSNEQRRVPGWVCKPLACDFIAYAVAPSGICYLLPVLALQSAWRSNQSTWIGRARSSSCPTYREVRADNGTYITLSIALPIPDLFSAMGQALRITFDKSLGVVA